MLAGLAANQTRLVPMTPRLLAAELAGRDELTHALGAVVPWDWPPQTWDRDALTWLRGHLDAHPEEVGWWGAYLVSHDEVLVGILGLKGPPKDGEVEIGYTLVESSYGMGYATDAVETIVEACAARDDIDRVVLHTLDDGAASQAVAHRAGFRDDGRGADPGTHRFVRRVTP